MAVADAQHAERGQGIGRFRLVVRLFLAELPRGAAVGLSLEDAVELGGLQRPDVQGPAAPGAPEVQVAERQTSVAGDERVRRLAPGRRTDLDDRRGHADAAEQADAHARVDRRVGAEDDLAIERLRQLPLHRADQERPADRLADDDPDHEHGQQGQHDERPAHAGTPRGERTSHAADSSCSPSPPVSVGVGGRCGPAPTVAARAPRG
jgi:hypothetical protein